MPKIQRYHHSQNFLHSPQRIKELVAMSGIGHRDTVIEIGGGSGNITAVLAEICSEVIVIEIDPKWAKHLTHRFRNNSRVRVVKGDFLEFSLPEKI